MAVNMIITLVAANTYISATGRQFKKGENYELPKDEAMKLLASVDDYEVHYFKKADGPATQESTFVPESPLPTTEEVAADMNDPTPSDSSAENGEMDTATETKRGGKKAVQV